MTEIFNPAYWIAIVVLRYSINRLFGIKAEVIIGGAVFAVFLICWRMAIRVHFMYRHNLAAVVWADGQEICGVERLW